MVVVVDGGQLCCVVVVTGLDDGVMPHAMLSKWTVATRTLAVIPGCTGDAAMSAC